VAGSATLRLLIDQNLAAGLARHLADIFPGSRHVRDFGLREESDNAIAAIARREGFVGLTKDADFGNPALAARRGLKVVLLRIGNRTTAETEALVRAHAPDILTLVDDHDRHVLVLS
jgi:predicted nuclease of predicted toxin-antitoxin system